MISQKYYFSDRPGRVRSGKAGFGELGQVRPVKESS
jgi:hypothetical protein